jgi:protein dithiol:quinone oxidoreductase
MPVSNLNMRVAFAIGAAVCALLLAYGFFLQYVQGLEPCPLCLVQRGFFFAVLAVFVIAVLHAPGRRGTMVYSGLAVLFALGGAAVAGRQVWLQHLPADKVPQCGPDLYFMLENFPLSRVWKTLLSGTGECAAVDWTFLGLSIAGWSLVWFAVLTVYAVWIASRRA